MQNIPKNELIDKLAAGWKCRRKSWEKGTVIAKEACTSTVSWWQLLSNDWEGEPPGPVLKEAKCSIIHAFWQLRNGAAFIRRASWPEGRRTSRMLDRFEIHIDELLANDWEVWG